MQAARVLADIATTYRRNRHEQQGHPVLVDMSGKARNSANGVRLWNTSEELTSVEYRL